MQIVCGEREARWLKIPNPIDEQKSPRQSYTRMFSIDRPRPFAYHHEIGAAGCSRVKRIADFQGPMCP